MPKDDDNGLPMAEDAIPINALRLTEAYEIVVDAIELVPERGNDIDEDWIEALRQSRELEKNAGHEPEEFDAEFEEFWHLRKIANVFLRSALENNELRACIRDPRTGETLRLPPSGWLSQEWIARGYVPSGVWQDHAFPDDDEIPGPRAALIAGELRPIFFDRNAKRYQTKSASGRDHAQLHLRAVGVDHDVQTSVALSHGVFQSSTIAATVRVQDPGGLREA